MFDELICSKCGKKFIPAPQHIYVDGRKIYCSWHCYNHRKDVAIDQRKKIKKVELYSPSGCLLKVFKSTKAAADETGFNLRMIGNACRGDRKTYMGFIWKYRE